MPTEAAGDDDTLAAPIEGAPPEPVRADPPDTWPHYELWTRVRKLLLNLPGYFQSDTVIAGVLATDLFSFNASLGSSIEEQVVESLNSLRDYWDPAKAYADYTFVRRPQRFPDVTLQRADPEGADGILMGIELKGWYVLAKEREPSFRFQATPAACAPADLIAIFPWALDRVVSGTPKLFAPYVESARYAAEYRNWHWEWKRRVRAKKGGDMPPRGIDLSTVSTPYPALKSDQISDKPQYDGGGNFGRIARTNLTKVYIEGDTTAPGLMRQPLLGIPLWAWQEFFAPFAETATEATLRAAIQAVATKVAAEHAPSAEEVTDLADSLLDVARRLTGTED